MIIGWQLSFGSYPTRATCFQVIQEHAPGPSMFDPWLVLDLSRMDLSNAGPHPTSHPGPYPGLLSCIQEYSWIAL